jgi:DNA-binding transcriptional LysR family regulator
MDVRRLQVLRELAERGSVTAVAAALHLTPSAVSQQLKALEREAGLPLTERSGRGIQLTVAGRALAETATDVAVAIERAEATWAEFKGTPRGEVSLATFPTAGQMLVAGTLDRVAQVPGLRLTVTDHDSRLDDYADLTADFDVVLADGDSIRFSWRQRRLAIVELLREPLDIALPQSHPLAARAALRPEDVVEEPWIGVPRGYPYDRIRQRIESITGRRADVLQRISDNRLVEVLVAHGHGIAILPRFTTRERGDGLVTRPLVGVPAERVIWALMRPERAIRYSVVAVVEALKAEASRYSA